MSTRDELASQIHGAICETNLDDCLEWRGRCVKAAEVILARYGVVELPEVDYCAVGELALIDDKRASVQVYITPDLITSKTLGQWSNPGGLRTLAAVLLAAANRAEAQR
ncbi:hypothetical protein F8M49_21115 [Rhodococcus zopfii]|uniref:Uncharacterized protein n=1 Tax=Rhodococcus zopfii TaxID=43772 RepID=A0ABU3WT84_9NOCA|nr:hypothetical protein [Rhodococcus zopfii]MDV2477222.1 hypothetical protein [Rhodococcus zopfii]